MDLTSQNGLWTQSSLSSLVALPSPCSLEPEIQKASLFLLFFHLRLIHQQRLMTLCKISLISKLMSSFTWSTVLLPHCPLSHFTCVASHPIFTSYQEWSSYHINWRILFPSICVFGVKVWGKWAVRRSQAHQSYFWSLELTEFLSM